MTNLSTPICKVVAAAVECANGVRSLRIELHEGAAWRFEFSDARAAQEIGNALLLGTDTFVQLEEKGGNPWVS